MSKLKRLSNLERDAAFARLAAAQSVVAQLQDEIATLRRPSDPETLVPGAEAAWAQWRGRALARVNERLALARAEEDTASRAASQAQGRADVVAQLARQEAALARRARDRRQEQGISPPPE